MTCERCTVLEERIAWLEGELRAQLRNDQIDTVRRRFRLTTTEARLVLRLYAARRSVSQWLLVDELVRKPESEVALNALKVLVSKTRRKLGRDTIDTIHGAGYALSPVGRALVYQAIGKTLEVAA